MRAGPTQGTGWTGAGDALHAHLVPAQHRVPRRGLHAADGALCPRRTAAGRRRKSSSRSFSSSFPLPCQLRKPLIERKRRERINNCLDQLKETVVGAFHLDVSARFPSAFGPFAGGGLVLGGSLSFEKLGIARTVSVASNCCALSLPAV